MLITVLHIRAMIIFMGNFVMFASMNAPTSFCAPCLQTSSLALNHWRIITLKMICNLGPIAATVQILYKLKKLSYYYCLWFGCVSNKQIRSLTRQKIMQLSKICVNNVWRFHYGVMSRRSISKIIDIGIVLLRIIGSGSVVLQPLSGSRRLSCLHWILTQMVIVTVVAYFCQTRLKLNFY